MATVSDAEIRRLIQKKHDAQKEVDALEDELKTLSIEKKEDKKPASYYWVSDDKNSLYHRFKGCCGANTQSGYQRMHASLKCPTCCKRNKPKPKKK